MKMNILTTGTIGAMTGLVGAIGLISTNTINDSSHSAGGAKGAGEKICLLSKAPFFEDIKQGCYSKAEIDALYDRELVNRRGESVSVVMTSPPEAPEASDDCKTCKDYNRMQRLGWFALSGKDQRREEYFGRACGMLDYLSKAQRPTSTYFTDDDLKKVDVAKIPTRSLLRFSPRPADEKQALETQEQVKRINPDIPRKNGQWVVKLDEQRVIIQPLAHADFNEDGIGDMLVFMRTRLNGGTASGIRIGYLTKLSADGEIIFNMLDK